MTRTCLPTDDSRSPTTSSLDLILKFHQPPNFDAAIGSGRFQAACGDKSGVSKHVFSFSVLDKIKIGTQAKGDLFILSDAGRTLFTTDISGSKREDQTRQCHLTSFTGNSLSVARDPSEWVRAISSAVIEKPGYYVMILNGYYHHDISIGNVLLSHEAIKVNEPIMETLCQLRIGKEHLDKLETLADGLCLSDDCTGFMIDTSPAIGFVDEYSGTARQGRHSGTDEFMSVALIRAVARGREFLQSPVDDFYSFFFTAQWSAAFNLKSEQIPEELLVFRQEIRGSHHERNTATMTVLAMTRMCVLDYGEFLVTCQPFLRSWYFKIQILAAEWDVYTRSNPSNEALPDAFRDIAFKGVVGTLECAMEFMSRLEGKADGGR